MPIPSNGVNTFVGRDEHMNNVLKYSSANTKDRKKNPN